MHVQMRRSIAGLETMLSERQAALERNSVTGRLERMEERRSQLTARLDAAMSAQLRAREQEFAQRIAQLDCLSPLKVMLRGYALVYKDDEILSSVQNVRQDDILKIRLADGEITAAVKEVRSSEE